MTELVKALVVRVHVLIVQYSYDERYFVFVLPLLPGTLRAVCLVGAPFYHSLTLYQSVWADFVTLGVCGVLHVKLISDNASW